MKNKKFYRILKRILIILLAVIVVVLLLLKYRTSLFDRNIFVNENTKKEGDQVKEENVNNSEDVILAGKVKTPGALRIMSLINSKEEIFLSKDKIIQITNDYRKDKGNLVALKENAKLKLSAEKKLQDMFTNQYFEHISPTGVGIERLGEEAGYKYVLIGENLAMGNFKDDKSLVAAWMESIGHRENILNKNYREIGVAVGKGIFENKEVWIAVQHFGTPASVCPSINTSLYQEINSRQTEIDSLEVDLDQRLREIEREVVPYEENKAHLKKIEEYNNLVIYYNRLVEEIKIKIDTYNEQIRKFNICLIEYQ